MLDDGEVKPLQWCVDSNDVTALEAVLAAGGDLGGLDLDTGLGHAAFFGHWKVCDFLIAHGANVLATVAATGETPLHGAGRGYGMERNFLGDFLAESLPKECVGDAQSAIR